MGVVHFPIFGKQVGAHWLAMATLAATFGGAKLAMGGGDKKADSSIPPLNAKSSDEEKYIKDFLANIEAEEKKAKAAAH